MRRSLRPLIALGLLVALVVPVSAGAVIDPGTEDGAVATYDTPKPKPTERPDSGSGSADPTPRPTPKPTKAPSRQPSRTAKPTPKPTPKPIWATSPVAAALVPSTTTLAIGVDG